MGWPQVVLATIIFIEGLLSLFLHGTSHRTNFWAWLLEAIAIWWLLYMGGFWG